MSTTNVTYTYNTALPNIALSNSTITTGNLQSTNSFYSTNAKSVMSIPASGDKVIIDESAALEVNGKLRVNGIDLEERLSTIETILQIPTRDATMESKYPKLAELYNQYMKELEKYKTWERIKGDTNGTT